MDVIDLFSGCGGLSLGFMKEGYTVKKAVEFDEKNCKHIYDESSGSGYDCR